MIGPTNQEENAQVPTEITEYCVIQTLNSEANNVAAQTDIVMEAMANADICDDFPWEAEFKDILMGDAPMLQLQDMTDLQDNAEYLERLLHTLESDESEHQLSPGNQSSDISDQNSESTNATLEKNLTHETQSIIQETENANLPRENFSRWHGDPKGRFRKTSAKPRAFNIQRSKVLRQRGTALTNLIWEIQPGFCLKNKTTREMQLMVELLVELGRLSASQVPGSNFFNPDLTLWTSDE